MLIGVVSDTHGYLDPRAIDAFREADAILHAGDVGSEAVLEGLRRLAPVYAIQGNNDVSLGGFGLPTHLDLEFGGLHLHVVHELPHARPLPETNVVVFGHSHRQISDWREGVLYLNPGAAGRQGFHQLQTVTLLRIEDGEAATEEVILGRRLAMTTRRTAT